MQAARLPEGTEAAESGSEQAVEAVLRGEVHASERNRKI
jgi:hypothetical protein